MGNGVLIETSARHVHVTETDLKVLFGENATLTFKKALSQPGQFACEERVTLVGPKKQIANVSILGPVRSATQVEVSATDARTLGVDIAIRESGDLKGTPGCKIVGPCGEIDLAEGVIVAKRHIPFRLQHDCVRPGIGYRDPAVHVELVSFFIEIVIHGISGATSAHTKCHYKHKYQRDCRCIYFLHSSHPPTS